MAYNACMIIKRILQETNKDEKPTFAIDQIDKFGIFHIYQESKDINEKIKKYTEKYNFSKTQSRTYKNNEVNEITGKLPEKFIFEENNLKFLTKLNQKYTGINTDERIAKEFIKEYSANRDVLDLTAANGNFSIYSMAGRPKTITIAENNLKNISWIKKNIELNNFDSIQNSIWESNFLDFIDVAIETNTKYDLIILNLSDYVLASVSEFELNAHKEIIRVIQRKLMNPSAILFLFSNIHNFVLDQYIRPGADKLTKKTIPQEFLPARPHQCYAFYN